jgi:D-lactate dehydrogenase (cytochrome)
VLRQKLGDGAISTDDDDLKRHGYSEWSTINVDTLPIAIAYPNTTEEVSEIAKVCSRYKIPLGELLCCTCYVPLSAYPN